MPSSSNTNTASTLQQVNGTPNHRVANSTPGHRGAIALVANQSWSVLNFRLPVIRALYAEGYKIVVCAPVDESLSTLLQEPGVEICPLKEFKRNSTHPLANLRLMLELWLVLKKTKPVGVIHFGVQANIFGNLASKIKGIPSFCVVTGLGYSFLHRGWVQSVVRMLYRISFRLADKIIFENKEDQAMMIQQGLAPAKRTQHVPGCGIDLQHFTPDGYQPREAKMVFTFIGRLLYDKGLREFAEAAKHLKQHYPQAECWVLGHLDDENPAHIDRNELISWVRNGSLHYLGARDDVRSIIGLSDWIVLPSYREGLSRVLLEAMAMGKPVITTDTAGCRETVDEGCNGFLVPIKDAESLKIAMAKACSVSVVQRRQMGIWARKKAVEEYDGRIVGAAYVSIIQKHIYHEQ